MIDTNKRLVEVNEVLMQLSEEEIAKIPEEVILNIRNKMDKDYKWKYDENKELSEQGLAKDAIAILSYINLEYLLNEEQKKLMNEIYKNNDIKMQKELQEKYNIDNIFKNKKEETVIENTNLLVEIKKETFFKKLISFIKGLFNKNN